MKKIISFVLMCMCSFALVACGDSSEHIGEAKTPSGSAAMKGREYQSVVEDFEEKGFTNIKLEKIEDLVFGWLTKEGEVEEVSVGGDFDYSPDKWVDADIEVVIRYHAFPEEKEETVEEEIVEEKESVTEIEKEEIVEDILVEELEEESNSTIDSDTISELIKYDKEQNEKEIMEFVDENIDKEIELELITAFVENYKEYNTRFNYLLYAVENGNALLQGPAFMFEDVNYYDLNLVGTNQPDSYEIGMHCIVKARIEGFEDGMILLEPIEIEVIGDYSN